MRNTARKITWAAKLSTSAAVALAIGGQGSWGDEPESQVVITRIQAVLGDDAAGAGGVAAPEASDAPIGSGPGGPSASSIPRPVRPATPSPSDAQRQSPFANQNSSPFDADQLGLGTTSAQGLALRFSSTPHMVGDFFGIGGGKVSIFERRDFAFSTTGSIVSGAAGSSGAVLVFERDGSPLPGNDFATTGKGRDTNGDGLIDTFDITEPLAPNEVPTSPGSDFRFEGGTAVFTDGTGGSDPANTQFTNNGTWFAKYSFTRPIAIDIPAGGGLTFRRVKLAENASPFPRDRLFFSYNFFNDVIGGLGDVNRYTVGVEKTFGSNWSSLEFRLPFAATLDADQTVGTSARNTEFGNITVTLKSKIHDSESFLITAALGVGAPTARDARVFLAGGDQVINVANDAVHLLPLLCSAWSPTENIFMQSFAQLDIDLNGNPVNANLAGGRLPRIGTLNDATILFLDYSIGYWMIQPDPGSMSAWSMAPVVELHYSTTLGDADRVVGNGFDLGPATNRFDVLNLTIGTHFVRGERLTLTPAMTIPLRDDDDEHFDYEAAVQVNWLY